MTKWIRWIGLVAFVVLIVGTGIAWYLFADDVIEGGIKKGASSANGAQVDIAEFEIALFPFGFELENMAFTDPEKPTHNSIEFDRAALDIDFIQLLLGRLIINEVAFTGVRFDTQRPSPGEVYAKAARSDEQSESSAFDMISLPTADQLLAEVEALKTVEQAQQLAATWQQVQVSVPQAFEALPDQARLQAYDERVDRLKAMQIESLEDAQQLRSEIEAMQGEIGSDVLAFAQAKVEIETAKAQLNRDWQALQDAPNEDWQAIRSEYSFDQNGLNNATRLLLGDEIANRMVTLQQRYQQAKPIIEWIVARMPEGGSGEDAIELGRFVSFPVEQPLPSFLLKQATFSIELSDGTYFAELTELTNDQTVRGRATELVLRAGEQTDFASMNLTANFDRRDGINDSIRLQAEGWQVPATTLIDQPILAGSYQAGGAQLQANWQRSDNGWQLDGAGSFPGSGFAWQGDWADRAERAVQRVDSVELSLSMAQTQGELETNIGSNLDDALSGIVQEEVAAGLAALESKVRERLQAEIAARRAPYDEGIAQLTDWETRWQNERQAFETRVEEQLEALKQQAQGFIDGQRQQLEDAANAAREEAEERLRQEREAAQQRLQAEQERLEAERRAAEEKAEAERRAAEERAKQEAQDKLKDAVDGVKLPGF
ncbi:TIGR03545 family protein [Salinibius halmophilus]|uniref:TIGR03545 family protein n=1 Tax=Salinibius halmophilus TaxID=1853216 RepID=UPI000E664E30|nr:TIGR03545 family protein [Salinibius halmophilus]